MRRTHRFVVGLTAVTVATLALSGCSLLGGNDPERDEDSGEITEASDSDVFALRVGDCLDSAALGDVVETVPVVPCDEPHDSEVFASTQLADGDYPGDEAVATQADEYCYAQFSQFVGMSYEDSALDFLPMYPLQEGWEQLDDREVLCLVVDLDGGVTGTLKGAAR